MCIIFSRNERELIQKVKIVFNLIIVLFILTYGGSAQQSAIKIRGIKVNRLNLNFESRDKKIVYLRLEDNTAAPRDLDKEQNFSLMDDYCNLNFRWKNPLKFIFTWKDSAYANEQQEAEKSFLKSFGGLFGGAEPGAAASNSKSMDDALIKAAIVTDALVKPENGLKDYDLTMVYITLMLGQTNLTPQERKDINKFTPKLKELEKGDVDYWPTAKAAFKELFDEVDPYNVTKKSKDGVADVAATNVDAWVVSLKANAALHDPLVSQLADIKIANELYNTLFHTGIMKYLDKSKVLNAANVSTVNKLTPIIEKMKSSVTGASRPFGYGGYVNDLVRMRIVNLEEGKDWQTEVFITEYKISGDELNVEKVGESDRVKLIFRAYEPYSFTVSTGLFYGSTSLKGFGVSTSGGDMLVTEDNIESNVAVTALFGNFNFGIGSRLIAPIFQLGIDPTKKHPFILLGGGLGFPVANFAITAGGIWTFEPSLSKLKVGDKINSTTDLDKDIKNNFQMKPKGWYFGIQYNF